LASIIVGGVGRLGGLDLIRLRLGIKLALTLEPDPGNAGVGNRSPFAFCFMPEIWRHGGNPGI